MGRDVAQPHRGPWATRRVRSPGKVAGRKRRGKRIERRQAPTSRPRQARPVYRKLAGLVYR